MKRIFPMLVFFLMILPFPLVFGEAPMPSGEDISPEIMKVSTLSLTDDDDCVRGIQYTEAQKKRLDEAYDRLYKDYEHLFQTYTSFGAMEKGQKDRHLAMLKAYIERIKKHQYRWCNDDDEWDEDDRWSEDSWKMDDRGEKGEMKTKPEMGKEKDGKINEEKKEKMKEGNQEKIKEEKGKSDKKKGKKEKWEKDDGRWEKDDDRWEKDDKWERDDDRWEKEDDKWDRD